MEFKISSKKLKLEVEDKHPPNSPKLSSKVISGGEVSQPPVAPTPERNNEEALINSDSPLTWPIDSEVCDGGMIVDSESSPRTPKAHTFDPFAPGEDNMGPLPLPPPIKKKSKVNVCRRLNFDNCAAESLVKESVIRRLNLDDCPIRAKEVKAGASSSSSLPSPSIGQVRQRPVPNKPPLPQKKTKASTFR